MGLGAFLFYHGFSLIARQNTRAFDNAYQNVNATHSHHNASLFTAFTFHLRGWVSLDRQVCATRNRGARSAIASAGSAPRGQRPYLRNHPVRARELGAARPESLHDLRTRSPQAIGCRHCRPHKNNPRVTMCPRGLLMLFPTQRNHARDILRRAVSLRTRRPSRGCPCRGSGCCRRRSPDDSRGRRWCSCSAGRRS